MELLWAFISLNRLVGDRRQAQYDVKNGREFLCAPWISHKYFDANQWFSAGFNCRAMAG
jgi:hypothetical protein